MEPQHEERRLTTILAADVVGYSRLMAADEAGIFARLKAHRKELLEPNPKPSSMAWKPAWKASRSSSLLGWVSPARAMRSMTPRRSWFFPANGQAIRLHAASVPKG